jgi:hypothetical protein
MDLIPLPRLALKIRQLTGESDLSYSRIYRAIIDGRIPAVQRNGRYYVREMDIPVICAALGLRIHIECQPETAA